MKKHPWIRCIGGAVLVSAMVPTTASAQCVAGVTNATRRANRVIANLDSMFQFRAGCHIAGGSGAALPVGVPVDYFELAQLARSPGDLEFSLVIALSHGSDRVEEVSPSPCAERFRTDPLDVHVSPGIHGVAIATPRRYATCRAPEVFIGPPAGGLDRGVIGAIPPGAQPLGPAGRELPRGITDVWLRRTGGRVAQLVQRRNTAEHRTDLQAVLVNPHVWPFLRVTHDQGGRLIVEFITDNLALLDEARRAAQDRQLTLRVVGHDPFYLDASDFTNRGFRLPARLLAAAMADRFGEDGAGLHPTADDVSAVIARVELSLTEHYSRLTEAPTPANRAALGDDVGRVYVRLASAVVTNAPATVRFPTLGDDADRIPFVRAQDTVVAEGDHAVRVIDHEGHARCAELGAGSAVPVGTLIGGGRGAFLVEFLPGRCEGNEAIDRVASRRALVFTPDALVALAGSSVVESGYGVAPAALGYVVELPPAAFAAQGRVPASPLSAALPVNPDLGDVPVPGAPGLYAVLNRDPLDCTAAGVSPVDFEPGVAFHAHLVGRMGARRVCLAHQNFTVPPRQTRRIALGVGFDLALFPNHFLMGVSSPVTRDLPMFSVLYPVVSVEQRWSAGPVGLTLWGAVTAYATHAGDQDGGPVRPIGGGLSIGFSVGGRSGSVVGPVFSGACTAGSEVIRGHVVDTQCGVYANLAALFDTISVRLRYGDSAREVRQ